MPAPGVRERAADHGSDSGRDAKEDGDLAHDALRFGRAEDVAHDGARDHDARASGKALQGAADDELLHIGRQGAADGCEGEDDQAAKHDGAAAQAVGKRAVKEVHEREAEQIGREGLLHLRGAGSGGLGDGIKSRDVGVDGKGTQHAQNGQQNGKRPAGALPGRLGFSGVHEKRDEAGSALTGRQGAGRAGRCCSRRSGKRSDVSKRGAK